MANKKASDAELKEIINELHGITLTLKMFKVSNIIPADHFIVKASVKTPLVRLTELLEKIGVNYKIGETEEELATKIQNVIVGALSSYLKKKQEKENIIDRLINTEKDRRYYLKREYEDMIEEDEKAKKKLKKELSSLNYDYDSDDFSDW